MKTRHGETIPFAVKEIIFLETNGTTMITYMGDVEYQPQYDDEQGAFVTKPEMPLLTETVKHNTTKRVS